MSPYKKIEKLKHWKKILTISKESQLKILMRRKEKSVNWRIKLWNSMNRLKRNQQIKTFKCKIYK